MSEIKKGDLVHIIGCAPDAIPHCGPFLGLIRTTGEPSVAHLGHWNLEPPTMDGRHPVVWHPTHLKKIDPPATGDEVSTQRGTQDAREARRLNERTSKRTYGQVPHE